MADPSGTGDARELLLNQLADEFAARQRRGERPGLQEYCDRHPDLAEDIRALFPAMLELERVKADAGSELAVAEAEPPPVTLLGDFRLLREVGRGGMGVVYEAEQISLGRRVALKILPEAVFRDPVKKRRFEREAKSAAKMHHTNIVPVHGFGEHEGTPYLVMQFIAGLGLDAVIDELAQLPANSRIAGLNRPMPDDRAAMGVALARSLVGAETSGITGWHRPARDVSSATEAGASTPGPLSGRSRGPSVSLSGSGIHLPGQSGAGAGGPSGRRATYWESVARIGVQVGGALAYAHRQGILHRDIKPANLLLDLDGTVWVTDFGLAKADDSDNLTRTGDLLGTLRYMAPEAFDGRSDARSDVYALGLTLFELAALRPAYQEQDRNKLIKQVMHHEPPRPSSVNSAVPRDLETVVLKAIDREPSRRYQTAGELVDDLQRYLEDRPVRARRASAAERYWRWARRNPVIAVLGALLMAVLVLATVSSLIVAGHMARLAENERAAAQLERSARLDAEQARAEAGARERGERWERYRSNIAEAAAAQQLQNSSTGERVLEAAPEEYRNWEWRHLDSLLDGASAVVPVPGMNFLVMRLSPDGRQAAVAADPDRVRLFDVPTGRPGPVLRGTADVKQIEYSPDGRQLGTGAQDGTIRLWDPATGQQQFALRADGRGTPDLRYRSDGRRITSTQESHEAGKLRHTLWDPTTGRQIAVLGDCPDTGSREVIAFRPDGKVVVAASGKFVRMYDADTGRELSAQGPLEGVIDRILFCPDGKRFVVNRKNTPGPPELRDGTDGRVIAVLTEQKDPFFAMGLSAGGFRLATTSLGREANSVRLWRTDTGQLISTTPGHTNTVIAFAFSPDGKRLASAARDNTGRLWDTETGKQIAALRGHTGSLFGAVFSPDSTRLVTASGDSTMRLWDAGSGEMITVLRGHRDGMGSPQFTPDGSWLVSPSADHALRIWDMKIVERNGVLRGHKDQVYDVKFRPDGKEVASAAWDGTVRLWDPDTGHQVRVLRNNSGIISAVAYSPDGRLVAAAVRERGVSVWNAATGERVYFRPGHTGSWRGDARVAFSPDGKLLAAGSEAGPIRLWSAATGERIAQLSGHAGGSCGLAFAPDGATLVSGGLDGTVRLWDVAAGKALAVLRGHADRIIHIAFSPDGRLIASGSVDRTLRLWDAGTRKAVATINLGTYVHGVAFSPDGTRLALGCGDTTIRLIDVARRQEVVGLRGHTDFVSSVAWSPDGTRLVSASGDMTVRVWDSLSIQERAAKTGESQSRREKRFEDVSGAR
jgi:WD40 repeat protein/serine/threonine protein kinase